MFACLLSARLLFHFLSVKLQTLAREISFMSSYKAKKYIMTKSIQSWLVTYKERSIYILTNYTLKWSSFCLDSFQRKLAKLLYKKMRELINVDIRCILNALLHWSGRGIIYYAKNKCASCPTTDLSLFYLLFMALLIENYSTTHMALFLAGDRKHTFFCLSFHQFSQLNCSFLGLKLLFCWSLHHLSLKKKTHHSCTLFLPHISIYNWFDVLGSLTRD